VRSTALTRRAQLVVCASVALLSIAVSSIAQVPVHPAAAPADRLDEPWWADRHKALIEAAKAQPDTQLLLIGDSITNNYDKANPPDENFQPTWKEFYDSRKALNFGFSGDTTANVLWRLDHGEVAGLHPKVAVVMIGTNNTGWKNQSAEEAEIGIDAVIADLEQRLPQTHILLLGILPSDLSADKTARDQAVNRYLASCYGENARVTYLDIGSIFFAHGALNTAIFYDPRLKSPGKALHPDTTGQHMMAEAIEPTLARLMGDSPRMHLASMTDINTALIPVDWIEQDSYDWYARHHAEFATKRTMQPRVVLIGDSITHFWSGPPAGIYVNGPTAWQRVFGSMPVLNMGFGWDRTQNVLWRIRQGEFEGLRPEWVVLMIGTNNLTATSHARANTPEEVVDGIAAIEQEILQSSPQTHIMLMGVLPRGADADNPFRAPIQEINRLLAKRFSNDPNVTWLDIGAQFLVPDGTIPPSLMPDALHPSDAGYHIWADELIKAGIKP
jgi:lysophospholipase L1-like esterase